MVSKENNNRRVTKPELKARIKELEKRLMFIDVFCKPFLHKVADQKCRLLQSFFVGCCKGPAGLF